MHPRQSQGEGAAADRALASWGALTDEDEESEDEGGMQPTSNIGLWKSQLVAAQS